MEEYFNHYSLGILQNILSLKPNNSEDEYFLFKKNSDFYIGILKDKETRIFGNVKILTKIKKHRFVSPVLKFHKMVQEILKNKITFKEL